MLQETEPAGYLLVVSSVSVPHCSQSLVLSLSLCDPLDLRSVTGLRLVLAAVH